MLGPVLTRCCLGGEQLLAQLWQQQVNGMLLGIMCNILTM